MLRSIALSLNKLFTSIQRWKQGIPKGPSYIYNSIAAKFLNPIHAYVAREAVGTVKTGDVVVDVGCGVGSLITKLLSEVRVHAVGLDISLAMLELAKKNTRRAGLHGYVDLVLGDAHKLPFRDDGINLIVSTGTLHHIRRPHEVFKECVRVLKNGCEAWIYEFSHDISPEEAREFSKEFKVSVRYLKLAGLMHGIPRREFESGYIRKELELVRCPYEVKYRGFLTKLILRK